VSSKTNVCHEYGKLKTEFHNLHVFEALCLAPMSRNEKIFSSNKSGKLFQSPLYLMVVLPVLGNFTSKK